MLSFRLSVKRVLIFVLVIAVVAVVGVSGIKMIRSSGSSVETVASEGAPAKGQNAKVKTNEQRLAFLQGFGWELEEEAAEIMEVIIPQEFDDVYQEYNSMQLQQGYDLTKYAGKRVKRYTYVVTNYPGEDGEVRANLLVYDHKVIGGDVCSLELDGFMHGFSHE